MFMYIISSLRGVRERKGTLTHGDHLLAKCKNQRLTKGKVAPVSVVKTKKKVHTPHPGGKTRGNSLGFHCRLRKGYGLVADATIKPRTLIMEYMGEVRIIPSRTPSALSSAANSVHVQVISETEKNRRMKRRDDDDNCYFMELYSQKVSMHRRSTYAS
jgi:hypothetical protein